MDMSNKVGSITRGKLANVILTKKINSYGFIPYSFSNSHIESVIINGHIF
jgi:imidazolonepropionase